VIEYKHVKVVADKLIALMVLPFFLLIFLLILVPQLILYKKVFFVQERPGKSNKLFSLLKFQTMTTGSQEDEHRVTVFGNFLRKSAIDEIPQVLNILKGEMSFVGPRPLLVEYLKLYNKKHNRRHEVLPGITGLAQIKGNVIHSWVEKLDYDIQYVDHFSFKMDLRIVLETIKILFIRAGKSKQIVEGKFRGYEA